MSRRRGGCRAEYRRARATRIAALVVSCWAIALVAGCGLPRLDPGEVELASGDNRAGERHHRAVGECVSALADLQRARLQGAQSDWTPARQRLDAALSGLRSADGKAVPRGMDALLEAIESASAAVDAVAEARGRSDEAAEERAWRLFDDAALDLALELQPRGGRGLAIEAGSR